MGESIVQTHFTNEDRNRFFEQLRKETLVLKKLFESRAFEYRSERMTGLEVEAWLQDENQRPTPMNARFLNACDDKNIVEEISQFNFELNTKPLVLQRGCFVELQKSLENIWQKCQEVGRKLDSFPVLYGIHPMVRDEMLQPEYMSDGQRYKALNDEIFKLRKHQPLKLDIKGFDHFKKTLDHILIEAAATSVQIHLQANQEDFRRVYNASILASVPSVALAANSPFLYGNSLWDETRIPLFEQAVNLQQFRDKKGNSVGRVTFGTGYIRQDPLEVFLENLDGYSPLLPVQFDEDPVALYHLRFHNGTLWRWNRPIIGFNSGGIPHLRVEQRAMASGPTIIDVVANVAFATGLTEYFASLQKAPEESMTFTDCRNNFYSAAQFGLNAKVRWFGKDISMDQLILDELLPQARRGLMLRGVSAEEINIFLDEVIRPRVISGQNGACWQRAFIECNGRDFQALARSYYVNQLTGEPVHRWPM